MITGASLFTDCGTLLFTDYIDGFPIDAAELINLVDEPFYGVLIE
jgi:hypothetical protein